MQPISCYWWAREKTDSPALVTVMFCCLWSILALSACQDSSSAEPGVTSAAPPTVSSHGAGVLGDPHRFDCTADSDCVNSCAYGAVSAPWYARAQQTRGFIECVDGCNNQISEPPRCEAGGCVAYQHDPSDEAKKSPRPTCTRVVR